MIVDNEEFYEQEKPLSLKDIRCLIIILRQVNFLVYMLWFNTMEKGVVKPYTVVFNSLWLCGNLIFKF